MRLVYYNNINVTTEIRRVFMIFTPEMNLTISYLNIIYIHNIKLTNVYYCISNNQYVFVSYCLSYYKFE